MAGEFEVFEDKAGEYGFRLKASNGEIVAVGGSFDTLAAAKEGCAEMQLAAAGADVVDVDS